MIEEPGPPTQKAVTLLDRWVKEQVIHVPFLDYFTFVADLKAAILTPTIKEKGVSSSAWFL